MAYVTALAARRAVVAVTALSLAMSAAPAGAAARPLPTSPQDAASPSIATIRHHVAPARARRAPADQVTYAYDAVGRLAGVVDASGLAAGYTYDAAGHPTEITRYAAGSTAIFSVRPLTGAPGDTVTVSGTGFASSPANAVVALNGSTVVPTSVSSTTVTFTVPAGASSGDVTIASPRGVATSPAPFRVTTGAEPSIDAVSPRTTAPGDTIMLATRNADPVVANNVVSINRTRATVVDASAAGLTVMVPEHGVGSGQVRLLTPAGTANGPDLVVAPPDSTADAVAVADRLPMETRRLYRLAAGNTFAVVLFDPAADQALAQFGASTFGSAAALTATVYDPYGTKIETFTGVGAPTWSDSFDTGVAGTYSIVLRNRSATGSIALTMHDVAADVETSIDVDGAARTVTTTDPGQRAFLAVSLSAGQRVTATYAKSTFPDVTMSVLRPDGTSQSGDDVTLHGPGPASMAFTAAADGVDRIAVDPWDAGTGSIRTRLVTTVAAKPVTARAVASRPRRGPWVAAGRDDRWRPSAASRSGAGWTTGDTRSDCSTDPLRAPVGSTTLTGTVCGVSGNPIGGVEVSVAGTSTQTARDGRFVLSGIPAGRGVLKVDGSARYGRYDIGFRARRDVATGLPFTIWLTKLDARHATPLSAQATTETVVTTPAIPGFEVRLPEGSTVQTADGAPVASLSITALPVDRPPFPLPAGVDTPVYFTVQPGGSVVMPRGATIVYPNLQGLPAGTRVEFWDYDPRGRGWYVYGHGSVDADGEQISPDPGVRYWEFSGAMITSVSHVLNDLLPGFSVDGDPVDLHSGLFVDTKTDLLEPDVVPLALTRVYRQGDPVSHDFGVGTFANFDIRLVSKDNYQEADLLLPGGAAVHFTRTTPGNSYRDAVYRSTTSPGQFHQAELRWHTGSIDGIGGWDLRTTDGSTMHFADVGPLQWVRDRNGNTTTLTREPNNYSPVAQITSPNGRWIAFTRDSEDRITAATDNSGRTVRYAYDADGHLVTVTDPLGNPSVFTYDAAGRKLTSTDARGITYVRNTYDSDGRVSTQTLSGNAVYSFEYATDDAGNVVATTVTDPEGNRRRLTFDSDGYWLTDTRGLGTPAAATVSVTREPDWHAVSSITDGEGRTSAFDYDANGRVAAVRSGVGAVGGPRVTTYANGGPFGQITAVTDPLNHTQRFTYDPETGDLLSATNAMGRVTTYTYNGDGQVKSVTNPLGETSVFGYTLGDPTSSRNPLGSATTAFVDSAGRAVRITDPVGNVATLVYDSANQLLSSEDALGGVTAYEYDANGNVTAFVDPLGHRASFTYDESDRPSSVTDPEGLRTTWEYDRLGELLTTTQPDGAVATAAYDSVGRVRDIGFRDAAGALADRVAYSFDRSGLVTSVSDGSGTVAMEYDDRGELVGVRSPEGSLGYGYDDAGRRVSVSVAGSPSVSYGYNAADLLKTVDRGAVRVSYTYDAAGRLSGVSTPNATESVERDAAGAVAGIAYARPGGAPLGDLGYRRDAAGRVVGVRGSWARVVVPGSVAMGYDAAGRVRSVTDDAGTRAVVYDDAGRLRSDGALAYGWDARGRLAWTTGRGGAVSYRYDALDRRVGRSVDGVSTVYVFDGAEVLGESGGGAGFTYLGGGGVDDAVVRVGGGSGSLSLLGDQLGSMVAAVGGGGVVASYGYDPWGGGAVAGRPVGGAPVDPNGLVWLRARFYSPVLGRFVSPDPLGYAAGPDVYGYAGGDPVNGVDPYGLFAVLVPLAVGGVENVAVGWAVARLSGRKYTFADAATDFVTGALFGYAGGRLFGLVDQYLTRAAAKSADEALAGVADVLGGLAKGRSSGVRTVGSDAELDDVYGTLTRGGAPFDVPGYKGTWIERTDGIRVGLRDASKSGGRTIDIRYPDGTTGKVHIE